MKQQEDNTKENAIHFRLDKLCISGCRATQGLLKEIYEKQDLLIFLKFFNITADEEILFNRIWTLNKAFSLFHHNFKI